VTRSEPKTPAVQKSGKSGKSGKATTDEGSREFWNLKLYVAGQSTKCLAAVRNLNRFCEAHLAGRYRIEVIDLLENPRLARDDQILAIPTLVRKLPEPLRRIVGDLSNTERMLVGFDLQPTRAAE
jgi:circadian clock protein KaiB